MEEKLKKNSNKFHHENTGERNFSFVDKTGFLSCFKRKG